MDAQLQQKLNELYPNYTNVGLNQQTTNAVQNPNQYQPQLLTPTADEQQRIQERVEHYKIRACEMLSDWYAGEFKRIAGNRLVEELEYILELPLSIKDRMTLTEELNKLKSPEGQTTTQSNTKSCEELISQGHKDKQNNGQHKQDNKGNNK